MENIQQYQLGKNNELLRLDNRADCEQLSLALVNQASHSILIFSQDLDPGLYNSAQFVDAVRQFIGKTRHATIKLLASDMERISQRGHRLLDLSHRQPSRVQIRKLGHTFNHAFLLANETAVLDRRRAERYEATANFNDPGWAVELQHFFHENWEKSQTSLDTHFFNL